jgi:hypothetical protein
MPFDLEDARFELAFARRALGGIASGVPVAPGQAPVRLSPAAGSCGDRERRDERSRQGQGSCQVSSATAAVRGGVISAIRSWTCASHMELMGC